MKKSRIATFIVFASLSLAACSPDNSNTASSSTEDQAQTTASSATSESTTSDAINITIAEGTDTGTEIPADTLVMRQMYTAPHGTKSFAAVNVLMNGETIIDARVDEFQYLDPADFKGVPNADAGFGEAFPEGTVLASKTENDTAYSALMKDKAGATQTWQASMDAITAFVKGKTVADLETAVGELDKQGEDGNPADVVSGATFADTKGYLQAIVDTAKNGMVAVGAKTDATDLKQAQSLGAPHGDKSFAITTVAMDGDKVAAVFVDEFQYVDAAAFGGVPNSDTDFGQGVAAGQVLASKVANNEAYSALMKDKAGATQEYAVNMQAVEDFAIGKTVAEIEVAVGELDKQGEDGNPADVVSGATFADTKGYLQVIADTAKKAE
ncbi:hypothetical protein [Enterococcus saccharolyticus]|uniref:Peptidoglycan-binding protein n=1 Tax=Enterococcus saccharolyticus subsp. saccharolyticus ATCC 43076 TaxID=1139996 RepID=S0JDY6_9ENTE|nr:hypothetical protein [Enterococcus saccharolyticus]EOT30482.1 hypothetical protein OMQ_00185 [Enterococcus saccharolyticus subsp. saccharolyticus ATCC 43076]EOT80043.1 hypothetical protein I572_00567 [Enterococcus saccharolyticus subsp. saccharolyticus ATCC 43076]OJG86477.1 hypothetical protein RV16_GL000960 [Enterococcus saccharolyticus]